MRRLALVIEDKGAFMKALRAIQLPDTPQGAIKIDAHGNPIVNVYIRRVERRDGRLMNVVIDTYRDVSQFWKYDPATFLASLLARLPTREKRRVRSQRPFLSGLSRRRPFSRTGA